MPEDRGEDAFAVEAVERIGIGVTDARRLDLDQDLAGLRAFQVELDDLKRLLGFECDCGAGLHLGLHKTSNRFVIRAGHAHFLSLWPMQASSALP
jgi:hypothetical protein